MKIITITSLMACALLGIVGCSDSIEPVPTATPVATATPIIKTEAELKKEAEDRAVMAPRKEEKEREESAAAAPSPK